MLRRADRELVWQRSIRVGVPFSSLRALCTSLWDMVEVKKIIRSGLPSLFFRPPEGLVNTLAEHL